MIVTTDRTVICPSGVHGTIGDRDKTPCLLMRIDGDTPFIWGLEPKVAKHVMLMCQWFLEETGTADIECESGERNWKVSEGPFKSPAPSPPQ